MNPMLSKLTRWVLWALLGLFLATSAAAFEYTYMPGNIQPTGMYFNGSASLRSNLFLLTPNVGYTNGSIVLDNLPKTQIKAFTVRFGLRMTNANTTLADGVSFGFGPGITTGSVADEKGITNGLAVALDTYRNESPADPSWVPGISIRWNGEDKTTTSVAELFDASRTNGSFHDVVISMTPAASPGGLSTVSVQYKGVVVSGQVQYNPAPGDTWRMILAGRTGRYTSEQSINQIQVTARAAELTVISSYGAGQASPQAGTFNPAAFEYTYHPASLQSDALVFNGSAANRTNLFWLTPDLANQQGSIVLNNLPRVPITEFTARIGLLMTNNNSDLADGVSFNFSPGIGTNSMPTETGVTNGLAVCFDTYRGTGDPGWTPGMAIRWNGVAVASTNIQGLLFANKTNAAFRDVVITLEPQDRSGGFSAVTVQYQGVILRGSVPYVPASNEVWRAVIGARTGRAHAEHSIDRIQISGTSLQPSVASEPYGDRLIPASGVHEITETSPVVLQAPEFVYLDRYRRELDPTPENIGSIAHYRARLANPAVTVTPSGGAAPYSIANGDSMTVRGDATVTWHWVVDNLAEVDPGTGSVVGLSATDITDSAHVETLGRRYLFPGTTGFDSLVNRSVVAAQQGNVRFGSRGYVMENAPNSPERYLELAGEGDHLRTTATLPVLPVGATRYTVEFWARRNVTAGTSDQVVLSLGSANGAGQRLLAGFGGDRGFFFGDGATRVSALPGWTDDEWHHWAAVCSGTGDTNSVALYRDGVLVKQSSDVLAPFRGDGVVIIGARAVGDYATAFFSGGVNNVRVWGRALDRTNLYTALATRQFPTPTSSLLLEMPFDAAPINASAGVHVERLIVPAGVTNVADVDASYRLQQSYTVSNFVLPSTNAIPLSPTNVWHHRARFVTATGGRYTFLLEANGSAQFWVDGQVLIDKSGTNGVANASISLTPGGHVLETWMIDPANEPRSLFLRHQPDTQEAADFIADSSLSRAAYDLLASGQVTASSTEGSGLVFIARGFEGLFPSNTSATTIRAALQPGFRLGLTALEGGLNTVQVADIGKAPLDDWRRVFWGWNKEFQFKVGVQCPDAAGLAAVSRLPYFTGEVPGSNVDGSTSSTAGVLAGGVVNVLELWLREGEQLSVGTLYRTSDRRYTLSDIVGNFNAFADITVDKLVDGIHANGVTRVYHFPGVFAPGNLNFSYDRTIHRVNLALGQSLDVSTLAAVNAALVPELPDGASDLQIDLNGPSAGAISSQPSGTIPGGSGVGWLWDFVGKKWHPTRPGRFSITWPDVAGRTNTIEVSAGFPGDPETRSGFVGFENKDGTRLGSATNRYLYTYVYSGVAGNYPGAPRAHYYYNIPPDGASPAPADLDPKADDDWFFKELSFAENNSAQLANSKTFTDPRVGNRSVLAFTRRSGAKQIATGNLSRESVTIRVLATGARMGTAVGTVGARLESPHDSAGFHSGFVTPLPESKNYNLSFYSTNAAVGQWGPIYPVNYRSKDPDVGQSLSVDWYASTAGAEEPTAYLPDWNTTYTNIVWPDANNPATPVIYISSQMGSEGVGQAVATNGTPNYQELLDSARFPNLAIYSQPDRNAIGYNPNEEHALIAPSRAFELTGDRRFKLGQSSVFALQNGLNKTNRIAEAYTSDPFVLVQYGVPGAVSPIDAFGMKVYAVKTVRTNDTVQGFPALDPDTHTAFAANGAAVPQPDNPRYDFAQYTAVAGNRVTPPYPLSLVIGNVTLTNTIGGNLAHLILSTNNGTTLREINNAQRVIWQDKNGGHWVVAGGSDARFFERYFYPLRSDFWLGESEDARLPGTPVAWVPNGEQYDPSVERFVGSAAMPVASVYHAFWGNNYPVLKKGESLTYAGGEYKADHPSIPGLPAVVNMASAEVVFDGSTPSMILTRPVVATPKPRYCRFTFSTTGANDPSSNKPFVQLGEVTFFSNGSKVRPISAEDADNKGQLDQNPPAQKVDKLFDGDEKTVWLRYNVPAWVTFDFGTNVLLDSYTFTSGLDAPWRDPSSWFLEASEDGSNWNEVGRQDRYAFVERQQTSERFFLKWALGPLPFSDSSARITRPLATYAASISQEAMPGDLQPGNPAKVLVSGSRWYFKDLPASLGKRFYYDSILKQLIFRGRLNDLEGGAPNLTQQPVQPYLLEPNFLTDEDVEVLESLPEHEEDEWTEAIEHLHAATRTEFTTGTDTGLGVVTPDNRSGLVTVPFYDNKTLADIVAEGVGEVLPVSSFGIGSALVANPRFLQRDPGAPVYMALAENNDPRASGAVALHILQISQERYRGSIQVLTPQDAFSEKINLRHTGDFGGNTAEIYYQWWVHDVAPLGNLSSPDDATSPTQGGWQVYKQGLGLNAIDFAGDPRTTLADKFFFVRYGGKEELQEAHEGNGVTNGVVSDVSWRHVAPDMTAPDWSAPSHEHPGVPYQWAGAANSPQLQANGSRRYIPQLVMGWVKRVLDQINPYEARFSATFNGDAPATYSSMLQQAGGPYVGPVAFNADKNNLENVGLIQLYETVLQRAKDLTQGTDADAGTDQALLLAATRLTSLYGLLGNEAWADAQTVIVPQSPDLNDDAASALFAFKNEVATPLDEQLALLRGTDFLKAYPSFNRLFWNYLKADGEAAYNAVYNVHDVNNDGLIDESDAARLYPMGHGDAWGHYLSAVKMHYDLLRRPGFTWQARAEYYSLLGNVLPVDYLDEKTFATLAAARARAGVSIIKATYAQSYSADPAAQWQGYTDAADPARAWGVSEWTRRTGQGAWFDWLAANAMTPVRGTNTLEGLDRIDRAANQAEVASLAGAIVELQQQLDNANRGQNPIGLDPDAMAFDIDPFYDGVWWERAGQFDQVYDRALAAANNALAAYNFARRSDQQLRRIANDTDALKTEALRQDLDYKNRLIAIYGRPFQGTIGPGKIFAEGYTGPDLVTYMYMSVTSPKAFKPEVVGDFVWQKSVADDVVLRGNALDFQAIGFNPTTGIGDNVGRDQNSLIFNNFHLTKDWGHLILSTPNRPASGTPGVDTVLSLTLPISETADFAFEAPAEWGSRSAVGEIQSGLKDTLQAQIALDVALEDYDDYTRQVQLRTFYTRQKLDALQETLKFTRYYQGLMISLESVKTAMEIFEKAKVLPKTISLGALDAAKEMVPRNIVVVGGDLFAPAAGGLELTKVGVKAAFDGEAFGHAVIEGGLELSLKVSEISEGAGKETIGLYNEFLDSLHELADLLAEEEGKRGALMAPLHQMDFSGVTSKVAEGERLQAERAALNRQIAASAQRNRYADLVVRLSRNEAARKFDAALDNALRYAWLAAKAYDYETSLSEGHPAGVGTLLDQIVQTRSLGLWEDGKPQLGNGGLADLLARLKANHDVLKGQIGLNNAQFESGLFSLRSEAFRISTDAAWAKALTAARVPDLWQVPEFRQYCRPFDSPTQGAQPGLVLQFSTEIMPGKNLFGHALSAMDHAFSGANYATKIRNMGVGFPGYDQGDAPQLSISPRVYLIPVGQDIQRCSDSRFPTLREWNVVSQRIPVPYVLNTSNLNDPQFQPSMDGLGGSFVDRIRFGDFRAFTSDHDLTSYNDLLQPPAPPGWSLNARLYGRSVWNTRWMLIVPGATLSADKDAGLDRFIHTVKDIKLFLQTYSNMGM